LHLCCFTFRDASYHAARNREASHRVALFVSRPSLSRHSTPQSATTTGTVGSSETPPRGDGARFDFVQHVEPLDHLPEDDVLSVERLARREGDEELRPV
jgi:hypothetical protein